MSEELEQAKNRLNIKDVTLRQCLIKLNDDIDVDHWDTSDTEIQAFRGVTRISEIKITADDEIFWEYHFYYACGIRMVKIASDDKNTEDTDALVEITATFDAKYQAKDRVEPQGTEAYSEENVGYHVWPYWREFVQSACGKLNIGNIATPMYFCTPAKTR